MPPQVLVNRVASLEQRVTDLERLPERITAVESQVVQLRTEMHDEFSAVRAEMKDMRESLRTEIAEMGAALREEIADTRQSLGGQIDQLGPEMRVLHEDVIGRLAVIQEGQSSRRRAQQTEGGVNEPHSRTMAGRAWDF